MNNLATIPLKSLARIKIIIVALLPLVLGACFTGVESTPRIGLSDVRKQQASNATAEQLFLTDIKPLPPSQWQPGRELLVANNRISLIFTSSSDNCDSLAGHRLFFDSFSTVPSLTGDDVVEATFRTDDGRTLYYRIPSMDKARIDTIAALDIPFTVDLALVAEIDNAMRGRHLYVRTPSWYDFDTKYAVRGLRHVEVAIDSVVPGDENFPASVCFTVVDDALRARVCPDGKNWMLYMSIGNSKAATRNFNTLFAFENPRKLYPEIKDDVWQLIIASRVREGMTRDECRLALGVPPNILRVPTYGGMREQWGYSDGVYLIFDDGFLSRFRL
ncbi:MAG: hypothetical protein J1F05_06640 [Muribaculaceae bacterium]|nr:hypothetical protein [Muribaculaceae bacterium]